MFFFSGCSKKEDENSIKTNIYFFEDKTNKLSILDLLDSNNHFYYQNSNQLPLKLGRSGNNYWLYFDLDSTVFDSKNNNYCMVIDRVLGGETDFFVTNPDYVTYALESINSYLPTFCFDSSLEGKYRFYLRIEHSRELIYFSIYKGEYEDIVNNIITPRVVILSVLLGGFFIVILYHLLLMINLRDYSYSDVIVFSIVFLYSILIRHELFPEFGTFNAFGIFIHPVLPMIILMVATKFSASLLDRSKERMKVFDGWINKYVLLVALSMPAFVFIPTGSYYSCLVIFASAIPITVLVLYSSFTGNNYSASETKDYSSLFPVLGVAFGILPWVLMQLEWIDVYPNAEILLYSGALFTTITLAAVEVYRTRHTQQESQQVKAINAAKDSFLMTMSHELRTPIHTVMGMNELLSQTKLDNDQQYYVKQINTASYHVLDMVDDVLDLTRINNNKPNFKYGPFWLNELIEKVEGFFLSSVKQKSLVFKVESDGDVNICLYGDQKRISQVIINLIGNAVKFTEKGSIILRASTKISEKNLYQIFFSVEDTGIGISQYAQKHLFQAFYQEQAERNRRYEGTGLGLAISSQLVTHMGGELTVRSELNQGSCFSFMIELPHCTEEQQRPNENQPQETCIENAHVLLVDDDVINASLGQMLLASKGAIVDIVHSGQDAIAYLTQRSVDVVLMDVSMPVMDGYEATSHIRNLPEGKQLPIVALTAHAITGERERCLAAGMNDYLTKPYSRDDIVFKVHHWLS